MTPPTRPRLRRTLGLVVSVVFWGVAERGHSVTTELPSTLDARLRAALGSGYAATRFAGPGRPPTDDIGSAARPASSWIGCFVEGSVDAEALRAAGAVPGTRVAGRWTVRVPLDRLVEMARLPGVRRVRGAARVQPQLDLAAQDTRAAFLHGGAPDTALGPAGDGVLIGIVDTGISVQHPDFRNALGFTRIAALWDQNDALGPGPSGFGYGTEWSAAQIDLGLCREQDSVNFGHGTHVAGIAAGNGRATGNGHPAFTFVGMAPRARLAVVSSAWDDVALVDGVAWLFQKATQLGAPCVVNLSLGTTYGPHDGTGELDIAMNDLVGPGRLLVAAAGNLNGKGSHAETVAPSSGTASVGLRIFNYTANGSGPDGVSVNGWYEGGDNLSISIRTPGGSWVGPVQKGGTLAQSTPDGYIAIDQTGIESTNVNGDVEVLIEISDAAGAPPAVGEYEVAVGRIAAPAGGQIDLWVYDGTFSYPPAFTAGREEQEIVISPGTADSVISVGAHTTRTSWTALGGGTFNYAQTLNQIGTFSGVGPRRDGMLKPDLTAPGTAIGSAHAPESQPNPAANILGDGVHKILQGTSMASPQVAGAVALLLSYWPQLSAREVRDALRASARRDAFTGPSPGPVWGWGKLDVEALFRQRMAFTVASDPPGVALPGGRAWLHELCFIPAPDAWPLSGLVRVTDSRGWLAWIGSGGAVPMTAWQGTTAPAAAGESACVPPWGHLILDVPASTPSGDSTIVTLTVEPPGLPFLRQSIQTKLMVSGLSAGGPPAVGGAPLVRVLRADRDGLDLELAGSGEAWRMGLIDVTGRRVWMADPPRPTGTLQRFRWSAGGRPLARGLYFLRVEAGARAQTLRVVVL